jgi:hypothetical protein
MKLSKSELDALEQADYHAKHDAYLFYFGRSIERGWFMPQHHECGKVSIRWQTCVSLCGKGLFEYRTLDYVKRNGQWRAINEYHISEAGTQYLRDLEAQT